MKIVSLGRVRPRTANLSPFGEFLIELCRARSLTPYGLGLQLGITGRSRMALVVRKREASGAMLSYEQLVEICGKLKLTQAESTKLILLGLRELTPPPMLEYVDHLEREAARLRASAGEPPSRFRFQPPAGGRS